MPRYKVLDGTIIHDGKSYEAGETIELSEDQAALLRVESARVSKGTKSQTAKEIIELLDACVTIAEVDDLIAGDERTTVLDAAEKRKSALEEELAKAAEAAGQTED